MMLQNDFVAKHSDWTSAKTNFHLIVITAAAIATHISILLSRKINSRYSYHIKDFNELWQDKRSLKKG